MPSLPRKPCSEPGCHTVAPACGEEENPTAASHSPKDSPSVWPSPEQPQRILPQSGWMPLQAKSRLPSFCGPAGEGETHPSSRMLLDGKGTGTNQMEEGKPGVQTRCATQPCCSRQIQERERGGLWDCLQNTIIRKSQYLSPCRKFPMCQMPCYSRDLA